MNSQRPRTVKPFVLLAAGVVLGGAALATMISFTQRQPATAQSTRLARAASFETSNNLRTMKDLDASFAELASYVSPSVVHIRADGGTAAKDASSSADRDARAAGSQGSGVIYRADGYIVTNDHVVAGSKTVTVVFNDGRQVNGTVITGGDAQNDIAIVKVDRKNLPAAVFSDSSAIRVGQLAMAVGAPFGIENSVTFGHISGLGRANMIQDPRTGQLRGYSNLVQTDAAINPGNSGGPLFNIDGEVVGINSSIVGGGGGMMGSAGNVGIGFAIPSNQARVIADLLISKGKLERGYLGVAPRDLLPYEKEDKKISGGAYVEAMGDANTPSPARDAGIKVGDVITRIGDMQVIGQQDLRNAMFKYGKGARVKVDYIRDGKPNSANVAVGELPTQPTASNQDSRRGGLKMPFDREDLFAPFGDEQRSERTPPSEQPSTGERARLGTGVSDVTENARTTYNIPAGTRGALVTSVAPDSVAARNEIALGDVITGFNGKSINSAADLVSAMAEVRSGQTASITVVRFSSSGQQMRRFDIRF